MNIIRTIHLTVVPKSKKNLITPLGNDRYKVCLKAKPEYNQANELLIQALAEYFSLPTTAFRIITGHHSTHKRVDLQVS